jgi:Domain of unknown function (DUF5666)
MPLLRSGRSLSFSHFPILLTMVAAAIGLTTGCGSSGAKKIPPPPFSGDTEVTVVVSSTANDALSAFNLDIQSLTLTSQSGTTVSVLAGDWPVEFMHLNGEIEPVVALPIPQGIYTAATAVIGGAQFTCVTVQGPTSTVPGSLTTSTYAYGYTPDNQVTVNLPSPITITGDAMGLTLNLQVSQSASFPSSCYYPGIATYSITPTFSLTPATLMPQPANPETGKVTGLNGQITAIDAAGSSFTLTLFEGTRDLSISTNSSTNYEGISSFSSIAVGAFVDMDGSILPNGSLMGTRIAVQDPSAVQVQVGQLLQVSEYAPILVLWGQEQQGTGEDVIGGQYFSLADAVFQTSGQLTNLQNLPFSPSFTASNIVPGQNVYLTADTLISSGGYPYTPATTVTLMPQTVDGTILGSSIIGGFTDYTVSLASYDLFPALAVQQGQAALLNNPSQVEVYVDSNTQMLNTQGLAAGSTLRFYGLVFNDNGTLRMDCAQVNDGVAFAPPQSNSRTQAQLGQPRTIRRAGSRGMMPTITTITKSHETQP